MRLTVRLSGSAGEPDRRQSLDTLIPAKVGTQIVKHEIG